MKIILYDFDKTIYDGDSSVDFILFNMKKNHKLYRHIFKIIPSFFKYKFGKIDKTMMKEQIFSFLKDVPNVDEVIDEFWSINFRKIKPFYLLKKHDRDVIITASPEFLINPIKEKLGVYLLIGSKVDKKTGYFDGPNCHDVEKINRLNKVLKNYEVMEAYSDSRADNPMLKLAKESYYVKKNTLKRTKF